MTPPLIGAIIAIVVICLATILLIIGKMTILLLGCLLILLAIARLT